MPDYTITADDGKTLNIHSEGPLTQDDFGRIVDQYHGASSSTPKSLVPSSTPSDAEFNRVWNRSKSSEIQERPETMKVGPVVHTYSGTSARTTIPGKLSRPAQSLDADAAQMKGAKGVLARAALAGIKTMGFGEPPTPEKALMMLSGPVLGELGAGAGSALAIRIAGPAAANVGAKIGMGAVGTGVGEAMMAPEVKQAVAQGDIPAVGTALALGAIPGLAEALPIARGIKDLRNPSPVLPNGEYHVPVDPAFIEPAGPAEPSSPTSQTVPEPAPVPTRPPLPTRTPADAERLIEQAYTSAIPAWDLIDKNGEVMGTTESPQVAAQALLKDYKVRRTTAAKPTNGATKAVAPAPEASTSVPAQLPNPGETVTPPVAPIAESQPVQDVARPTSTATPPPEAVWVRQQPPASPADIADSLEWVMTDGRQKQARVAAEKIAAKLQAGERIGPGEYNDLPPKVALDLTSRLKKALRSQAGKLSSGLDPTLGMLDEGPTLAGQAKEALQPGMDAARNFAFENLSALRRTNPDAWEKAVSYATSSQQAAERAATLVPQVLEGLDKETAARFQPMLVADRIYNYVDQLKDQLATATPEEAKAIRAAGRKVNPPIDPQTGERITDRDVAAYFDRPEVQQAVQRHKELVEPLLEQNQVDVGADPNGIRGKYSEAFTPAIAADENNMALRAGGANGLRKPLMRNPVAPGTQHFSGSADYYLSDYGEAIGNRLYHGTRAANAVQMWKGLLDSGIAVDAAKAGDKISSDGTMKFDGRQVPAKTVNIESTFGRKINGLPENVWLPNEISKELKPVYEQHLETAVTQGLQKVARKMIGGFLFGTGDVVSHAAALSGRAAVVLPDLGNPIMRRTFETKSISAIMDAFRGDRSPIVRQEARRIAAKYGATRIDDTSHVGFGKALYGPNGYHTRMLETVYRYGKAHGWSERAIGQAMQQMNVYNKALAPTAQRMAHQVGAGTFYQTGVRNRAVGYNAFTTGKGIATVAGSVLLAASLQRATDPEGKWWYERPGQKFGEFYVGKVKGGKNRYIDPLPFLNRPIGYALQIPKAFDRAKHEGAAPGQIVSDTALAGVNQAIGPVVSGPTVAAPMAAMGASPYLTANDQHTGLGGFFQEDSAKKSPLSWERGRDVLKALFPITSLESRGMTGFPAYSERAAPQRIKYTYKKGQAAGARPTK